MHIVRSSLLELRTKGVFGFGRALNGLFAILGIFSLQEIDKLSKTFSSNNQALQR